MSGLKVSTILEFMNMLSDTKVDVFNHLIYNYEASEEIDAQDFINIVYAIYEKKIKVSKTLS